MIVEPKVREFICTTAHPVGCKESLRRQIAYTKEQGEVNGIKKALIIGSSTGYGLASRIVSAFGAKAATIGVMFEKEGKAKRTASAGWYNNLAFEEFAKEEGLYAKTLNGDAFSKEMKEQVIELIKNDLGKVDTVIYSLAAPRRTMEDGTVYQSTLKTVGEEFVNKSLNLKNNTIEMATISPANEEEIAGTVKVMGGEDWLDWIRALKEADVLEGNAVTFAYSYIGPKLTYPVYFEGTIGRAKHHLKETAAVINEEFKASGVKAYISVNKALVTQASAAIPVVPLYMAILYKTMKEMGNHENCIQQINRLFHEKKEGDSYVVDAEHMIRLDDWEMEDAVQEAVIAAWDKVDSDNILEYADIDGYWEDFYNMFGFKFDTVDYSQDVEI